jgi:hypothetical protein
MSNPRKSAIETVLSRAEVKPRLDGTKVSTYFGSNVFNDEAMKHYLSEDAYKAVKAAMKNSTKIDREMADAVAAGMKAWALDKGANSYTHWFQPLTGLTAEKHDMFFTPTSDGKGIGTAGARCFIFPKWWYTCYFRGARLYCMGPRFSGIHHGNRRGQNPLHTYHIYIVHWRKLGLQSTSTKGFSLLGASCIASGSLIR